MTALRTLLIATLLLAIPLVPGTPAAAGTMVCKDFNGQSQVVCGKSYGVADVSGYRTFDGYDACNYVEVDTLYLTGRGHSSYGGWHLGESVRTPTYGYDYCLSNEIYMAFVHDVIMDTSSHCASASCYGTTKHYFKDPPPGNRVFYTSTDDQHSCLQAWQDPGGDVC